MNANELIKYWDNQPSNIAEQTATMLRQQQAEIEALKQQLVTTSSEAKLNYNKGHEDGRKLAVVKELTDDGDAFRLAVKLKIEVYHGNDEGNAVYAGYYTPENTSMKYCIEYYDDITHMGDACSATRRAIVRAATEIGKTNPLRKASEKWTKNEYEPPDFFFMENDLMGKR